MNGGRAKRPRRSGAWRRNCGNRPSLKPKRPKRPERPSAILGACAVFYGVSISSLFADQRTLDIVKARHIAMYLAKELTPRSLPDIGRRMGGKDHTTVLHGVRKIAALIKTDPNLAAEVATIRARIVGRIEGGETKNRVATRAQRHNA
jgi:hypothetical protein